MSTTVQTLLNQLAQMVQENRGDYSGTNWSSGLWTVEEIIDYINVASKQFVLDSQIIKLIAAVASVTGQRIYGDPTYTMQIDRIAFNNRPTYRTTRTALDRENIKWRTMSGVPRQYHQDQLTTKNFEVDRAPTSAMTGSGYTATNLYGTLRQMSGAQTYTATIPAVGRGGIFRYSLGAPAINGILPHNRPYAGTLRQMLSGVTNFEVLATRLMDDVSYSTDTLMVPDFTVMYVKFYVLYLMLMKEGEGQDIPRAKYSRSRYDFGVQLFQRLMSASHDQMDQPAGAKS